MSERLLNRLAQGALLEIGDLLNRSTAKEKITVWHEIVSVVEEYTPMLTPHKSGNRYTSPRSGRILMTDAMRERFRIARQAQGIAQNRVRTENVKRNVVFTLETGGIKSIDPRQVDELATLYKVSTDWLLTGEDRNEAP